MRGGSSWRLIVRRARPARPSRPRKTSQRYFSVTDGMCVVRGGLVEHHATAADQGKMVAWGGLGLDSDPRRDATWAVPVLGCYESPLRASGRHLCSLAAAGRVWSSSPEAKAAEHLRSGPLPHRTPSIGPRNFSVSSHRSSWTGANTPNRRATCRCWHIRIPQDLAAARWKRYPAEFRKLPDGTIN